jgi:hypothetical protein
VIKAMRRAGLPERVLLFCLASGAEWTRAGVTRTTPTTMVVRGLIEPQSFARKEDLHPCGQALSRAILPICEHSVGQPSSCGSQECDARRLLCQPRVASSE